MKKFMVITYYLGGLLMIGGGVGMIYGIYWYWLQFSLFVEWELYSLNSSSIIMTFLLDWVSLTFMGLVMLISSMVFIYSTYYMEGDKHLIRFIILVFLFVASMLLMILSPNMISILLGWDGLGLVSYCLVIYYQNWKSANAGMITVLSNRVGDVAILLSISWLLNYGGWNFYYLQFMYSKSDLWLLILLVILAAMTKSAQMPFSAWLPAAMAAPTPVSALVHSSTLVTAGVYLLIRFNSLIGQSSLIFFIGVMTMFMSGLGANFESDLKKIIALSTLSQLGLMMMSLGLGLVELAFFHLLTHAMFKSLLFLCAGVFIHSVGDTQDIRFIGGLMVSCPVTSIYFITSSMALCGFPFLSGFYSKDAILESFFMTDMNLFMYVTIFVATMLTLTYSVRLMYHLVLKHLGVKTLLSVAEVEGMSTPMSLLAGLALMAGGLMSVSLFPLGAVFLSFLVKSSVLVGLMIGFVIVLFKMDNKFSLVQPGYSGGWANYTTNMWFLPLLSTFTFSPILKLGWGLTKMTDQGWVEFYGGQGAIKKMMLRASDLDAVTFTNLKFYMFLMFSFMIVVFIMCG